MAKKATTEQLKKIEDLYEKMLSSSSADEKLGYKTHIVQILNDIEHSNFTLSLITAKGEQVEQIIKNAIDYYS